MLASALLVLEVFCKLNEVFRIGVQTATLFPNEHDVLDDGLFKWNAHKIVVHFGNLTVQECAHVAIGKELFDCVQLRRVQGNFGLDAKVGKGAFDEDVLVAVRLEQNEVLVGKVFEGNASFVCQGVRLVYAKNKFGGNKRNDVVAVFHCAVQNGDAKVNGVGIHKRACLKRACFQHFQLDVGVVFGEGVEHLWEQKGADHCGNGNFYVVEVAPHVLHLGSQRVYRLQNALDFVKEVLPFHRQLQTVVTSMEQFDAELRFQLLDAKGNCGLRNKQLVCCLGDATVPANCLEVSHLQKFHDAPFLYQNFGKALKQRFCLYQYSKLLCQFQVFSKHFTKKTINFFDRLLQNSRKNHHFAYHFA